MTCSRFRLSDGGRGADGRKFLAGLGLVGVISLALAVPRVRADAVPAVPERAAKRCLQHEILWIILAAVLVSFMQVVSARRDRFCRREATPVYVGVANFASSLGLDRYFICGYAFMFGGPRCRLWDSIFGYTNAVGKPLIAAVIVSVLAGRVFLDGTRSHGQGSLGRRRRQRTSCTMVAFTETNATIPTGVPWRSDGSGGRSCYGTVLRWDLTTPSSEPGRGVADGSTSWVNSSSLASGYVDLDVQA